MRWLITSLVILDIASAYCVEGRNEQQEAREHYKDAAWDLVQAVAHAGFAAAAHEIPPLAVYELAESVKSFLKFGDDYEKGMECERRDNECAGGYAQSPESYSQDRR